jgi:hypothetical protein
MRMAEGFRVKIGWLPKYPFSQKRREQSLQLLSCVVRPAVSALGGVYEFKVHEFKVYEFMSRKRLVVNAYLL